MVVDPPLSSLISQFVSDIDFSLTQRGTPRNPTTIISPPGAYAPTIVALAERQPVVVVCASEREMYALEFALKQSFDVDCTVFPAWETFPYERISPGADTVGQRHRALATVDDDPILLTSIRALMQPVLSGSEIPSLTLRVGQEIDHGECVKELTKMGYEMVDLVSKPGHCAVRGGIIDVFPTTELTGVRVEFFGDEVTDIRPFSPANQRSLETDPWQECIIYSAKELYMSAQLQAQARVLSQDESLVPALRSMAEKFAQGIYAPGAEALAFALNDYRPYPLLVDVLGLKRTIIVVDPLKVARRSDDLCATSNEFLRAVWETATVSETQALDAPIPAHQDALVPLDAIYERSARLPHAWLELGALPDHSADITLPLKPAEEILGDPAALGRWCVATKEQLKTQAVALIVNSTVAANRVIELLNSFEVPAKLTKTVTYSDSVVQVVVADLIAGFVSEKITIMTDRELTGVQETQRQLSRSRPRQKQTVKRNRVDPLALQRGDVVVHEQHGIARFVELTQRTVSGAVREYVVLDFAPSKRGHKSDRLYVPMDSLELLSRYVGGAEPSLSKLGGSDWQNTKRAARKAVRQIAGHLVQLYAARQEAKGYAFSADTPWQRELEDAFAFEETPDQLAAIEDTKADMERPVPMDRVVIGDVGYGKTEVAVRAAFKAVQDGKQVALLAPTTLLVGQHLVTFTERMRGFPITIAGLSRFTSLAESKKTLQGLANGSVDIVIGTHKLLQTGVVWKDLGLVIVDEEQRFGVEHKEHITALRTHVDVLTLSATPIPRTLEMSLSGIRELSTIATAPVDRHPILTYVGAYDDRQVQAAISRELLRDGQVFYVHNKVSTIDKTAAHIRSLVPEARVAIAHGQMPEDILEQTVDGFWNRQYDVLVCTTIIETGLDIANANTLIVENSDTFGLSQLHQLRGRVGRSRERGFAYFLYRPDKSLTETAYSRLLTIAQHNDLGSGMAVAMKDLEIRGAGNILGAEQSGHIAGVGFDLYVRLVGEAVAAYRAAVRGEEIPVNQEQEVRFDLPVDAHIPADYISSEQLRLSAYRQCASSRNDEEIIQVIRDFKDRFGPLPSTVQELMTLTQLRNFARSLHLTDIAVAGSTLRISPWTMTDSLQVRLNRLWPGSHYRSINSTVVIPLPKAKVGRPAKEYDLIAHIMQVLCSISDRPTPQPLFDQLYNKNEVSIS